MKPSLNSIRQSCYLVSFPVAPSSFSLLAFVSSPAFCCLKYDFVSPPCFHRLQYGNLLEVTNFRTASGENLEKCTANGQKLKGENGNEATYSAGDPG